MNAAAGRPVVEAGSQRVWLIERGDRYPTVEHMLVAAPATVRDKQRPSFEARWAELAAPTQLPLFAG